MDARECYKDAQGLRARLTHNRGRLVRHDFYYAKSRRCTVQSGSILRCILRSI